MTSLPCLLAYLPTRLPTYFNPLILHPPHHPLLIPTFMPTNKPSQTSKKVYPHLFFPFFTQICAKVQRSIKCFFFHFFKSFILCRPLEKFMANIYFLKCCSTKLLQVFIRFLVFLLKYFCYILIVGLYMSFGF